MLKKEMIFNKCKEVFLENYTDMLPVWKQFDMIYQEQKNYVCKIFFTGKKNKNNHGKDIELFMKYMSSVAFDCMNYKFKLIDEWEHRKGLKFMVYLSKADKKIKKRDIDKICLNLEETDKNLKENGLK